MSWSRRFALAIQQTLREPHKLERRNPNYEVSGRLDIGSCFVGITVCVPISFNELKRNPPRVVCKEPWMKDGAEWHNSRSNGLCWVLANQWVDVMGWTGKSVTSIIDEGVKWLINDVTNLISRHYFAHCENLTSWPPEWDAWAHYGEGVKEYRHTD
jgi:hypothetical protein